MKAGVRGPGSGVRPTTLPLNCGRKGDGPRTPDRGPQPSAGPALADVLSGPGTLEVLSREAASLAGGLPPATRIETRAARGNLLSRGIDLWGGVQLRTPTGLEGRTESGHLDTTTMHSSGSSPVEVQGPNGYWLRAQGFDLHLREDIYEFDHVQSRVSAL